MEASGERTWLTLAELFVAAAFLVLIFGVFAAPIFGAVPTDVGAKLLGVALVLFASSMFVLAGHYNLYGGWGKSLPRGRVTKQEWAASGFSASLLAAYVVWWGVS